MQDKRAGLILATISVLFFSTSPIFIRWAEPLSAFQISFGRLAVGAAAILLLARLRGQLVRPARRDWLRFAGYGFVTAAHFAFYVSAVLHTTIAHALTIVYSAPIFVALLSAWLLKEPLAWRRYFGIGVAIVGLAILVGFEPNLTREMLIGDLLALGSAITFALYSVFGRAERQRYPLFTYAGVVYGTAALWLLPFAAATTTFVPQWPQALSVVGLGLIPMAAGHTLYNAAVRKTHAAYANLIATQEATGGVILGVLLLAEIPGPSALAGLVVTIGGIVLVLL